MLVFLNFRFVHLYTLLKRKFLTVPRVLEQFHFRLFQKISLQKIQDYELMLLILLVVRGEVKLRLHVQLQPSIQMTSS